MNNWLVLNISKTRGSSQIIPKKKNRAAYGKKRGKKKKKAYGIKEKRSGKRQINRIVKENIEKSNMK